MAFFVFFFSDGRAEKMGMGVLKSILFSLLYKKSFI